MTATLPQIGFGSAMEETKLLPTLNCLGYVESVDTARVTTKGTLLRIPFVIGSTQGGQKGFSALHFRPEWLRLGFDVNEIKDDKSSYWTYIMNIGGARDKNSGDITTMSVLMGIAGSEENYGVLATRIIEAVAEIPTDADSMVVGDKVRDVIADFVSEFTPEVGYYMAQKTQETGNITDNGKKEKVPVAGKREANGWFFPGPVADKRHLQSASRGKSVNAYEIG